MEVARCTTIALNVRGIIMTSDLGILSYSENGVCAVVATLPEIS